MECSIQRGEAELNGTFHLSTNQNILSIAQMQNIHYLFYITPIDLCQFEEKQSPKCTLRLYSNIHYEALCTAVYHNACTRVVCGPACNSAKRMEQKMHAE